LPRCWNAELPHWQHSAQQLLCLKKRRRTLLKYISKIWKYENLQVAYLVSLISFSYSCEFIFWRKYLIET
jgi:hypothetical protein